MLYRRRQFAWIAPALGPVLALVLWLCGNPVHLYAQTANPGDESLAQLARQITGNDASSPRAFPKSSDQTPLSRPLTPLAMPALGRGSSVASSATPPAPPTSAVSSPARSAADAMPLGPAAAPVTTAPNASGSTALLGGGWLFNTLTALAIVVGLIFLARGALTKWAGRNASTPHSPVAEVLARIPIAPRNHLVLVRLGQRILVLGDSANGLRTLESISDPEEIAELLTLVSASKPTSITGSFRQLVNHFGQDGQADADFSDATGVDDFPATTLRVGRHGDDDGLSLDRSRQNVNGLLARLRAGTGGAA